MKGIFKRTMNLVSAISKLSHTIQEFIKLLKEDKPIINLHVTIQQEAQPPPCMDQKLWTMKDLMEKFPMSLSTYNRLLADNILDPTRMSGTDYYLDEDIRKAIEKTRRSKIKKWKRRINEQNDDHTNSDHQP